MRAAIYLRRSTDRQEASIVDQRREVSELAKTRGHQIVAEFIDDGISGDATERRLGFQQMIQAAARKEFAVVLCWDQDRFGRFDPLEAGYWIKPMRDAGVVLETVAQGRIDWNDFAGRLLYTVTQEGKHAYLRDLARNCNRGVRKRVAEGVWTGVPPFGYIHGPDGRLALAEAAKVAAVQRVFALRAEGLGYRSIAYTMAKEGHPTPKGNTWDIGNVRYILARECYLGTLVIGRKPQAKYERMFDEVQRIENTHPAIITSSQWSATRPELFRGMKSNRRQGTYSSALGGMMTCGLCGHSMYVFKYKGELGYVCGRYHRGQGCGFCRVMDGRIRETLSRQFVAEISAFTTKELREVIAEKIKRLSVSDNSRELAKLDSQIKTATDRLLLVPKPLLETARQKVSELLADRDRLKANSNGECFKAPSLSDVMEKFSSIGEILTHKLPHESRAVFSALIKSIRCDFRQVPRGKTRRFYEWTGGEVFFHSKSSKQIVEAPDATLIWNAARTIIAAGKTSLRFKV